MKRYITVLAISLSIAAAGCSKKKSDDADSDANGVNGAGGTGSEVLPVGSLSLADIPDVTDMVNTSSALRLAVTGTAPLMTDLSGDVDTYFFDGAIAALNSNATVTETLRRNMDRGEAVCHMSGNVARTLSEMGGGSLCYMRSVGTLSSETIQVTTESATVTAADYSKVFAQEAADKLVKVTVVTPEGSEKIFIKVLGSNTFAEGYGFDMYQCRGGKSDGEESVRINYATGVYTSENSGKHEEGENSSLYSRKLTAYLKAASSAIEWDLSKDRIVEENFKHEGSFGSDLGVSKHMIDADHNLTSLIHHSGTWGSGAQSGTNEEKIWAKASVDGSSLLDLSMNSLAVSMDNTSTFGNQSFTNSHQGAVEWQTSKYAPVSSGDLYDEAVAYDFASEDLFSDTLAAPSVNTDSDCAASGDVEITFDMTTAEAQEVQSACEGGGGDSRDQLEALYQNCSGSDVQSARQKLWENN